MSKTNNIQSSGKETKVNRMKTGKKRNKKMDKKVCEIKNRKTKVKWRNVEEQFKKIKCNKSIFPWNYSLDFRNKEKWTEERGRYVGWIMYRFCKSVQFFCRWQTCLWHEILKQKKKKSNMIDTECFVSMQIKSSPINNFTNRMFRYT